jgi:hypothetical protein
LDTLQSLGLARDLAASAGIEVLLTLLETVGVS